MKLTTFEDGGARYVGVVDAKPWTRAVSWIFTGEAQHRLRRIEHPLQLPPTPRSRRQPTARKSTGSTIYHG
jgi:hypothetical protein